VMARLRSVSGRATNGLIAFYPTGLAKLWRIDG
jgi:hypothetical protein